jgi:RNA polymerase sigma-70 factor (ECF subfamily)
MFHPLIERMTIAAPDEDMALHAPPREVAPAEAPVKVPAFAEVYHEYFDFIWRSARRLGVRETAIEDFVQEIFLIVHRQLPGFEGRSTLRTWLYGIVLRAVREHRRVSVRADARRGFASEDDRDGRPDARALPDEQIALAQAAGILERVLDEMPPERREVFVMSELEQMTIPEISALTGEKLNTVYSRLRLAREEFERSAARYRARDSWRLR